MIAQSGTVPLTKIFDIIKSIESLPRFHWGKLFEWHLSPREESPPQLLWGH